MAISPPSGPRVKDPDVQRALDGLIVPIRLLAAVALVNGNLVEGVSLSTTAKDVPHLLGRKPQGYIVVSNGSGEVVFENKNYRTESFIRLSCSSISGGTTTVDLWVF